MGRTPPQVGPEDPDLSHRIHQLPDAYLGCRDYGHNWRPSTARRLRDSTYEAVVTCERCAARRVRLLSARGAVLSNHYEYPEQYLIPGMGRLTGTDRDSLRLESVLRVMGVTPLESRRRRRAQ